ncbi:helix-turn-helix domain-containing protein [Aquincola tertiaricarbonis]|uniref:helix-turn-helix domain-containing protein n=1 Tax=Aquincola tertiaricarbonis TaxID=391953 RepID=UPI000614D5F5|nr:AraC family transcriptional regulator [Aquincola tertiaricarbonis]
MVKTSSRCWNGMIVDLNERACTGRVLCQLERHEDLTRLGAQLEEVGRDPAETRSAANTPNPLGYQPRHLYFAPAEMKLWGHSADIRYVKCATISFPFKVIQERLGIVQPAGLAETPQLRFNDDRLWTLIKLLTEAIDDVDPTAQLYGDSLTAAIAAKLLVRATEPKGSYRGLSPLQLKDAIGYLEDRMPKKVELSALAELAGLSQSHYCRAFKVSTGLAPYQWQLQARIERAKDLLLTTNRPLDDVAEATGFADAVHFGRTFRRMIGVPPAAWRVDRHT